MKEQLFRSRSINLNYIEGPNNGPNLLLLHGGCSRWQSFIPIIPELSSISHLYALDLRGHGKSGRSDSYTLSDHVLDLALFIKEQIKAPTHIFGNSLGGVIALILAANHPELVQSLIVGDAPLTKESFRALIVKQKDFAHQIIAWLRANQAEKIYEALNDNFTAESLSLCDPNMLVAMFDQFNSTFDYETNKLFSLITSPVFLIRGNPEKDSLITNAECANASKLLLNMTQAMLPNVGHALLEDKSSLLKAIKSFITQ